MKRILGLSVLAICLLLNFAGCAGNFDNGTAGPDEVPGAGKTESGSVAPTAAPGGAGANVKF